ncbi:MAG: porin, partial [Firmicutes bacterium]|nr:porin [Bacillota bacterium]
HLIAALAGVMMLAVTAPAFAANVTGNLSFGYTYDLKNMAPAADPIGNEWGLALTGNVSDDVTVKIGFENAGVGSDLALVPAEAWIQAKNTPFGTVKLGAFEMAFGELNTTSIDEGLLNVQVANEFAGIAVSGGVQLANDGRVNALGASAGVNLFDDLRATVGVLAKNESGTWDPAIGYQVDYTGFPNLALGLRGNLAQEEMVGSAAYEVLPGLKVHALYGVNVPNDEETGDTVDDQIIQAGVDVNIAKGLYAGASYTVAQRADGEHEIISLTGGYDYELAKGLVVGLSGNYTLEDGAADATLGASVGLTF